MRILDDSAICSTSETEKLQTAGSSVLGSGEGMDSSGYLHVGVSGYTDSDS